MDELGHAGSRWRNTVSSLTFWGRRLLGDNMAGEHPGKRSNGGLMYAAVLLGGLWAVFGLLAMQIVTLVHHR